MRTILFISLLALLVALAATHSDTEQNGVLARDIRDARRGSRRSRQRNQKKKKPRNKSNKKKHVRGKFSRKLNVKALIGKGKWNLTFVSSYTLNVRKEI